MFWIAWFSFKVTAFFYMKYEAELVPEHIAASGMEIFVAKAIVAKGTIPS